MNPQIASRLDQVAALAKAKRFLGREYLVWLWHRAESSNDLYEYLCPLSGSNRKVRIWVDDRLTLEAESGRVHLHQMRGGAPAQTPEAAAGVLSGKFIRDLRAGFAVEGLGDFSCLLNSKDLRPTAIQLPGQGDEADVALKTEALAEPVAARLDLLNSFLGMMDSMFAAFMQERLLDSWSSRLLEMREWAEKRYEEARRDVEREAFQHDGGNSVSGAEKVSGDTVH